jgi:hypothetical protein
VTFTVQCVGAVVGGLLNYIIMKVIINTHREVLLDVQGSNVVSFITLLPVLFFPTIFFPGV